MDRSELAGDGPLIKVVKLGVSGDKFCREGKSELRCYISTILRVGTASFFHRILSIPNRFAVGYGFRLAQCRGSRRNGGCNPIGLRRHAPYYFVGIRTVRVSKPASRRLDGGGGKAGIQES